MKLEEQGTYLVLGIVLFFPAMQVIFNEGEVAT